MVTLFLLTNSNARLEVYFVINCLLLVLSMVHVSRELIIVLKPT